VITGEMMKTLAARLQWARTNMNLSQEALAKAAGLSQSTIGNLESGLRLTARRITAIADVLDVNPTWLSEGKGNPKRAHSSHTQVLDATLGDLSNEAIAIAKAFDRLEDGVLKAAVIAQLRAFGVLE
jgi:transcriptional regulator with XRE-family HTH domain